MKAVHSEDAYTVHHQTLRNEPAMLQTRLVSFDAEGNTEPLTREEWDYLIAIPGFTPVTPWDRAQAWFEVRDGIPHGPEVEVDLGVGEALPEAAPDPLAELFDRWRAMDINTRLSFAIDETLSVEALRALSDFEVKTRNSKKVLTVLHDQVVLRTKNRSGEQVNGALLQAAFPMTREE